MRNITLSAVVMFFMAAYGAYADTGNSLLNTCKNNDTYSKGKCMGYVIAIRDVLYDEYETCFSQVPNRQFMDIVIYYLEKNPEYRHYSASSIAVVAILEAFPACKS